MVLSAQFSRDAFKIYTSGITMQRYNSMLSSSIIFIFQSLIIHTDNLMIFLEDSRLMETMYILFSYLIWKMTAYINIHYLACSRHPTLAFVGKKKKFLSFDQHVLQQSGWRGQCGEKNTQLQRSYPKMSAQTWQYSEMYSYVSQILSCIWC